jgi:dTDP-glucose 4,6-dehydratase
LKNDTDEFKRLITHIRDPRSEAHNFRYVLDCSKIREELGWRPLTQFEDVLERTMEWYLEYYKKVYGTK